jgi:hypothetical protein
MSGNVVLAKARERHPRHARALTGQADTQSAISATNEARSSILTAVRIASRSWPR